MPPSLVHFNGSVNLPDAETVMREISARIPASITRIPDGETGDRSGWILFQLAKFTESGSFRLVPPPPGQPDQYRDLPTLELADGVTVADVRWPDPGYAQAYLDSYPTFRELVAQGVIDDGIPADILEGLHRLRPRRPRMFEHVSCSSLAGAAVPDQVTP